MFEYGSDSNYDLGRNGDSLVKGRLRKNLKHSTSRFGRILKRVVKFQVSNDVLRRTSQCLIRPNQLQKRLKVYPNHERSLSVRDPANDNNLDLKLHQNGIGFGFESPPNELRNLLLDIASKIAKMEIIISHNWNDLAPDTKVLFEVLDRAERLAIFLKEKFYNLKEYSQLELLRSQNSFSTDIECIKNFENISKNDLKGETMVGDEVYKNEDLDNQQSKKDSEASVIKLFGKHTDNELKDMVTESISISDVCCQVPKPMKKIRQRQEKVKPYTTADVGCIKNVENICKNDSTGETMVGDEVYKNEDLDNQQSKKDSEASVIKLFEKHTDKEQKDMVTESISISDVYCQVPKPMKKKRQRQEKVKSYTTADVGCIKNVENICKNDFTGETMVGDEVYKNEDLDNQQSKKDSEASVIKLFGKHTDNELKDMVTESISISDVCCQVPKPMKKKRQRQEKVKPYTTADVGCIKNIENICKNDSTGETMVGDEVYKNEDLDNQQSKKDSEASVIKLFRKHTDKEQKDMVTESISISDVCCQVPKPMKKKRQRQEKVKPYTTADVGCIKNVENICKNDSTGETMVGDEVYKNEDLDNQQSKKDSEASVIKLFEKHTDKEQKDMVTESISISDVCCQVPKPMKKKRQRQEKVKPYTTADVGCIKNIENICKNDSTGETMVGDEVYKNEDLDNQQSKKDSEASVIKLFGKHTDNELKDMVTESISISDVCCQVPKPMKKKRQRQEKVKPYTTADVGCIKNIENICKNDSTGETMVGDEVYKNEDLDNQQSKKDSEASVIKLFEKHTDKEQKDMVTESISISDVYCQVPKPMKKKRQRQEKVKSYTTADVGCIKNFENISKNDLKGETMVGDEVYKNEDLDNQQSKKDSEASVIKLFEKHTDKEQKDMATESISISDIYCQVPKPMKKKRQRQEKVKPYTTADVGCIKNVENICKNDSTGETMVGDEVYKNEDLDNQQSKKDSKASVYKLFEKHTDKEQKDMVTESISISDVYCQVPKPIKKRRQRKETDSKALISQIVDEKTSGKVMKHKGNEQLNFKDCKKEEFAKVTVQKAQKLSLINYKRYKKSKINIPVNRYSKTMSNDEAASLELEIKGSTIESNDDGLSVCLNHDMMIRLNDISYEVIQFDEEKVCARENDNKIPSQANYNEKQHYLLKSTDNLKTVPAIDNRNILKETPYFFENVKFQGLDESLKKTVCEDEDSKIMHSKSANNKKSEDKPKVTDNLLENPICVSNVLMETPYFPENGNLQGKNKSFNKICAYEESKNVLSEANNYDNDNKDNGLLVPTLEGMANLLVNPIYDCNILNETISEILTKKKSPYLGENCAQESELITINPKRPDYSSAFQHDVNENILNKSVEIVNICIKRSNSLINSNIKDNCDMTEVTYSQELMSTDQFMRDSLDIHFSQNTNYSQNGLKFNLDTKNTLANISRKRRYETTGTFSSNVDLTDLNW